MSMIEHIPIKCFFEAVNPVAINRLSYPEFYFDALPTKNEFWEIRYVLCGTYHITVDAEEYVLDTHQAIFIAPHTFSITTNDSNSSAVVESISFACDSVVMHFFENRIFNCDKIESDLFVELLTEFKQHLERKDDFQRRCLRVCDKAPDTTSQFIKVIIECLLCSIYIRCSDDSKSDSTKLITEYNHITEEILDYMVTHISEKITLEEIGTALNRSVSTLRRSFKKVMDESIINYFISMKIDHAAQMIKQSSKSIAEIAQLYNFTSPSYFAKIFKDRVGCTPSEYSKLN